MKPGALSTRYALVYDFTKPITSDVIVMAIWNGMPNLQVTFDSQGGVSWRYKA